MVQQDLKQLAEQHDGRVGAVGDVELALHQLAAGLACCAAMPSSEQVDDLIGEPGAPRVRANPSRGTNGIRGRIKFGAVDVRFGAS